MKWKLTQFTTVLPEGTATYSDHINAYSALVTLHEMASQSILFYTNQLKNSTLFLSLPLYSSFSRSLLYINQITLFTSLYIQLISNPYLSPSTFFQLVNDSNPPVQTLLRFCEKVRAWEKEESSAGMWEISKEEVGSIVVLGKFLGNEGRKGDAIWKRNHCILSTFGISTEIQLQLLLMIFLTNQQLSAIRMQEEPLDSEQRVENGVMALLNALEETSQASKFLTGKIGELKEKIESDGFCGVPYVNVEGEDIAAKQLSHLSCIDNSSLWQAVEQLKRNCNVRSSEL